MSEAIARVLVWLRGTAAIAGRELLSLFVTPLAYLVGTLFLLNQGWNFSVLLSVLNQPLAELYGVPAGSAGIELWVELGILRQVALL